MLEGFLNNIISKIWGELLHEISRALESKLACNSLPVIIDLGAGNCGYLGLALSGCKCQKITGNTFVPYLILGSITLFLANPVQL